MSANSVLTGYLINLSEVGALIRMAPPPPPPSSNLMLDIKLPRASVKLPARVVRSTLHRPHGAEAPPLRDEWDAGLDFIEPNAAAAVVRHIIESGAE